VSAALSERRRMTTGTRSFGFKYLDLAQKLRRQIALAKLKPGDRLPTEDELVQEHGLSRITIRRALAMLEKDGLVSRKRKLGTFVSSSVQPAVDLHLVRGTVVILICGDVAIRNIGGGDVERHDFNDEDHSLSTVLRGMERTLADRGFSVQIMSLGRNEDRDRARLRHVMDQGQIEGICAIGPCSEQYRELVRSVPMVHSCTFAPDALPWVGMSMEEATFECVGHLLDRGHQRAAVICGPWVESRALASFAAGARRAHEQRGLAFHRSLLYQAYDGEPLDSLVRDVLSNQPRPTAIFGDDWRVCRAVISAAEQLSLRIPEDVSLVGCGLNIQYLAAPVGITAYLQNNESVGEQAGLLLSELIDGRSPPAEPVFVPGRLIERQSVASPLKS
jgi:GntR family transcriptional regulator, arabinose operon transcriptional repressor